MPDEKHRIKPVVFLIVLFLVPNLIFAFVFVLSRYFGSEEFNNDVMIEKKEGVIIVLNKNEMAKQPEESNMANIEKDLRRILKESKSGELTQNTCNEKECSFTILGMEADRLHQVVNPVLKKLPLSAGHSIMIYDLSKADKQEITDLY